MGKDAVNFCFRRIALPTSHETARPIIPLILNPNRPIVISFVAIDQRLLVLVFATSSWFGKEPLAEMEKILWVRGITESEYLVKKRNECSGVKL